MEEQHDDHGTAAVGMQTAQKRAGGYGFRNIRDGRVGMIGGGNIIQSQKNPGDNLGNENK